MSEYWTFLVHEGLHPDGWRWTVWSAEQDTNVAEGQTESEDLAEQAAEAVVRLMEGGG